MSLTRKQRISQATPRWADARRTFAIYCYAARLRDAGQDVAVDHIIPLGAADVCGLHVPDNLQIVDRRANELKNNQHIPPIPVDTLSNDSQLSLF